MFIPRTLAELEGRPGRGALLRAIIVGGIVAIGLFLVLSANITLGQESLTVGDIATRDIRAPRDATFVSDSQTEAEQEAQAAAVEPQRVQIEPPVDNREDQLRAYDLVVRRVVRILEARDAEGLAPEDVIARLAAEVPEISASQRPAIAALSVGAWDGLAAAGRSALETVLADDVREDELVESRQAVRNLVTSELAPAEREIAGDLAATQVEFNLAISPELTEQARQDARDLVDPVEVEVGNGEIVVGEGERISELALETLEELGLTSPPAQAGTVIGNLLLASLLSTLLVGFLWRYQPAVWHRNRSVLLFFLALLVSAVAIRVAADRALWAYVVPTTATVLLIAILLEGGAGAAMVVALAVLAGVMNRDALDLSVFVLAGGTTALLTIVRAERLNAFVRTGLLIAAANVVVILAFSLLEQRDAAAVLQLGIAGGVNAGLSVLLAVGSFAMLGNVFGIMTVFQLLELANPSNRLLRRLLLETPGTYHHSVMVGNLAERAAETIGADPLLARVAAYYHDIGKMKNPLAFIENQAGAHNIHDDLNAETSARIIAGHIRDGIDLGYEHGLPVQVIGYIPQHHGTSVMTYFHQKALREVGGRDDLVDERTYRYPGPKPQTREAAIIMLADGVEASVRSLDEKDEESIRAMVDRIVDARVEDGQLDDAELTLKNIAQIKDAFVGQLLGMYHSRIKYPDNVVPMDQHREQA
jgi:putative nucleotidyltransferase with HDIG domain